MIAMYALSNIRQFASSSPEGPSTARTAAALHANGGKGMDLHARNSHYNRGAAAAAEDGDSNHDDSEGEEGDLGEGTGEERPLLI